jgi:hypothetical protein
MNASSLAALLKDISADRRRALVHDRMVRVWGVLAIGLVVYAAGTRIFDWDAPWMAPALLGIGIVAWISVKRSVAKLEIGLVDIAREVEAADARLNSLLLAAYEEQQKAGSEGLSYLQERVVVEALEANRRSPWGQQYAERRFFKAMRHTGSFAVFMLALVITILVGPRGAILTRLLGGVSVTPGSAAVEKGSIFSVSAKFPEPAPADARLVFIQKTGPLQTITMERSLADPVFGGTIPEVQNDFRYHVEYKGKKTPEYQVTVFEYPRLNRADAKLKFPDFTGLIEKKIEDTRRVSAVEGTIVDYRLELNKPVRTAALLKKNGEPLALTRDQQFSNVYHVKIDLKESQKLSLALKDNDGRTNKLLAEFSLEALPNKTPDLKIVFPRGDQRVSALEEVSLNAEVRDDFGLGAYGLAYSMGGDEPKFIKVGEKGSANEKKALAHLLRVEELGAKKDELISYFAWAEDLGPDGKVRRTESDMYFAEVRPFEEIFRQGSRNQQDQQQQQQQGGGQQSPSEQLAELQKQIINATWKIQRTESKEKPSPKFKDDATVVRNSQDKALSQAEALSEKVPDPRLKALADAAADEMRKALDQLSDAVSKKSPEPLPQALSAERSAYQALLRLQAKEYSVSRQRGGGGGGGGAQQRAQRQLDELDLKDDNDRYEKQSQASAGKTQEQQEQMQVLNQLKDLARRQNDVNERLKELQAALQEAKTEQEKEELRRRLKRLQEEQQELVQDMDALNQKMAQSKNSEMADARQQLDKAREQGQKASEQMGEKSLGQAASAGARTEKDLKKLTEDFRKATAQQFNDEMRDMRRNARDLAEKEREIAQKIDEMKNPKQRTLSDAGGKDELARQLSQQRTNYSNILERMKKVSEEAESNEPLLSQKLYDTVREVNQQDTGQNLEQAGEYLKRSFVSQAGQYEQKARQNIETLQKGVDEAADRLLGDEAEALRNAARQLDELTQRLRNEAARSGGRGTNGTNGLGFAATETNGIPSPMAGLGTNGLSRMGNGGSTNQVAGGGEQGTNALSRQLAQRTGQNGRGGQRDRNSQNGADGQEGEQTGEARQQDGNGERQLAQNSNQQGQRGERGQSQQQGDGQQNGEARQQGEGQRGQGQESQQASNGQQGQQDGNQQGEGQGGGQGQRNQAGNNNSGQRFFDRGGADNMNAGSGAATTPEGPITGTDFRSWADQLRDVQEMIDEPDLRNDLARVLDRAREMRTQYVRHAQGPQWNLLENLVLNPLVEVRQRVGEELARRDASTVAPLDRDPVPGRYAELVSRYYQSLGQGAPVQKTAEAPTPKANPK